MVPLTIIVIGPLSDGVATAIANVYNYLYNVAPTVAAGGLWQIVVIWGTLGIANEYSKFRDEWYGYIPSISNNGSYSTGRSCCRSIYKI